MQNWLLKIVPSCFSIYYEEKGKSDEPGRPARRTLFINHHEARRSQSAPSTRKASRPLYSEPLPWKPRDCYKEIRELNSGSEAKTCLTRSLGSGRVFVVKHVSKLEGNKCTNASSYKPIPLEAWLLSEVLRYHPNIVKMFGYDALAFRSKNMYFEYCSGGDLIDQIDHLSRMRTYAPEAFVLQCFIDIAQALAYLHHGLRFDATAKTWKQDRKHVQVTHGDLKSDNIFLRWSPDSSLPTAVLGDFGMARPTATFKGISGTVTYEAPEVVRVHKLRQTDPKEFDRLLDTTGIMTPATDVYSFGIVMHMVATLKTHKAGADPYADGHMEGKARVGVKLPSEYWTPDLKAAIQRCLSIDPEGRPEMTADPVKGFLQTVEEFKVARDRLLAHQPAIPKKIWASPSGKSL